MPDATRPDPLVPRALIRSVKERVNSAGKVVVSLMEDDVRSQVRELVDAGAEAIVVSLVNSTENPGPRAADPGDHPRRVPGPRARGHPGPVGKPGVGPKGRVRPRNVDDRRRVPARDHVPRAGTALQQPACLRLRPSRCWSFTTRAAWRSPTRPMPCRPSTPAPSRASARPSTWPRATGLGNVISTDMGGTSFDIGLVPEGGRQALRLPADDRPLAGVGPDDPPVDAGCRRRFDRQLRPHPPRGADRARNQQARIRVPPATTAAACRPTVTDADLVLGYLDPDNYANGYIKLNPKRARSTPSTKRSR